MRFIRCAVWIVILMVLSGAAPAVLIAQDAAATPAVAAPWWHSLLSSEAVWNVVGGVVAALLGWVGLYLRGKAAKAGVDEATLDAVQAGAIDTYHAFVRAAKARTGGMTAEEAATARKMAYASAIRLAAGPAKDALLKMAEPTFNALLERMLGSMKRSNAGPAGTGDGSTPPKA